MSVPDSDFDYVLRLVRERTGIVLDEGQQYLAETRLAAVAEREGPASPADLMRRLRSAPPGAPLQRRVVEALLPTDTSFFRDSAAFAALRQAILPELVAQRAGVRALQIWIGACSSGQEPYSVAMLLDEHFPALTAWKIRIVASDVSTEMLARARAGRFGVLEVKGLSTAQLNRYFEPKGADWQISDSLRRRVEFRELNLAGSWPALPKADLILLRNVLGYFDVDTRRQILAKLRHQLRPGGVVMFGAGETPINLDDEYELYRAHGAAFFRARP